VSAPSLRVNLGYSPEIESRGATAHWLSLGEFSKLIETFRAAKALLAPSWQNDDSALHSEIIVKRADKRINPRIRERDAKACRSHWSFW